MTDSAPKALRASGARRAPGLARVRGMVGACGTEWGLRGARVRGMVGAHDAEGVLRHARASRPGCAARIVSQALAPEAR